MGGGSKSKSKKQAKIAKFLLSKIAPFLKEYCSRLKRTTQFFYSDKLVFQPEFACLNFSHIMLDLTGLQSSSGIGRSRAKDYCTCCSRLNQTVC